MSRPTPERIEQIRRNAADHMHAEGGYCSLDELLAEIDALHAEYTAPGGTTMGECPIHAIRWLGHAPCPTCKTENDALAARVRELENAQDGLIARFHAECCETECKCHCEELRAALGPTRRDA